MKWCKFVAFFDNFDDFISDDCGTCKLLAAMDNTVTNCIDLFKRFDNAVFSVCQTIKNELVASVWVGIGDSIVIFSPPAGV